MGSTDLQGLHQWLAGPVLRRAARTSRQSKRGTVVRERSFRVRGQLWLRDDFLLTF